MAKYSVGFGGSVSRKEKKNMIPEGELLDLLKSKISSPPGSTKLRTNVKRLLGFVAKFIIKLSFKSNLLLYS